MTLLAPGWLWLLLVVAGLGVAAVTLERRRSAARAAFASDVQHDRIVPRRPGPARHAATVLVGVALVLLVVALARPSVPVLVPRERAVVVLAVDVSNSMAATDVAPSRLQAAVDAAVRFVRATPERFEVGLVTFADRASVRALPSTDRAAVLDALGRLRTDGGTAAGDALLAALDAIERSVELGDDVRLDDVASVVLLSDGATTVGPPVELAARDAADRGVPVSTIAFGTSSGRVQLQGQVIPVPVDLQALDGVAELTGGRAFTAGSQEELDDVYAEIRGRVTSTTERREVTAAVLGAALLALALGGVVGLTATGRLP